MQKDEMTRNNTMNVPIASAFTSSPLRNRIRIELKATVSDVWALIGNLNRFPEYSFGLEKVEAQEDSSGKCTEYLCYFKPQEEGGELILHREFMRWYEPNLGFASIAEEGNVFRLTNSLTLVTLEPSKEGTIMTWEQYYDAEELDMNKEVFDQALTDIGENLVRRFGGKMIERYVEK
jgi:hypothetical protein